MRRIIALGAALAASSILVAGCGGGGSGASANAPSATAPVASAAPVAVAAVGVGGAVTAGPTTPKPVAKALAGSGVVVISFVVKGVADDDSVASALAEVRADPHASKGVAFFDYSVGVDKVGDLADRLGISGTPSVVVIGRDRTLVNLWSGLVDADILRQSISDAADTVAAHPGTKAVSGSPSASSGPTGSAKGIALATKVNAAYENVPGVRLTGKFTDDTFNEGAGTIDLALRKGLVTAVQGKVDFGDFGIETIGVGRTAYVRSTGSPCWAAGPDDGEDRLLGTPAIKMSGKFSPDPVTTDGVTTLIVLRTAGGKGHSTSYTIDAATQHITAQTEDGETLEVTTLDSAPSIPAAPTEVCGTPQEAFDSVPSSVAPIAANISRGCEAAGVSATACACVAEKAQEKFSTSGDIRKFEASLRDGDAKVTELYGEIQKDCGIS